MAHQIPYVATASVHDLHDLEHKVTKAMSFHGSRYIEIYVPCPLGWGSKPGQTITIARLAVETGMFPLFEAENGNLVGVTKIRHQQPVEEYLKLQRRFAHVFKKGNESQLEALQVIADNNIERFDLMSRGKR
jgi:pyruvate ferredoxin oxidoreductase beta subunit